MTFIVHIIDERQEQRHNCQRNQYHNSRNINVVPAAIKRHRKMKKRPHKYNGVNNYDADIQ